MEPVAEAGPAEMPASDPAIQGAAALLADFASLLLAVDLPEDAVPATGFRP